ncbi:TPA: DUF4888 domain-containing protein [Staphylococcus aureus]|uniref:DUF4888 domain-containing protein n=1 Tax=Staphylococcus aureus TaxID=1280 RepID=UPI0028DE26A7|nr:DUF4888 domain-containing protein [Staphylococcus aureus]WOL34371.1 DUF4888 domain-containing protein [Staphylococcus aureus]HDL0563870.1 DUF4888 domain-containing protein [Staphylococcus aureus]HDL0566572.1 DUF4888 domain-containing protein [Staphylococcus aureus]HDL0618475.1 DUF4888 domain-containing protein [Staphylococcus aureus]HDL0637585.1 DUF4888 domain-containing protein [Staphylococcus aureus]
MNAKFLGKTLVASALVLTTLGTGLHSSYLVLDTNKVVKTAKAEENMTNGQLWKKVKDSLIDGDIISGNENEDVKVTYMNKNGQSSSIESSANHNDDVSSTQSNFSKLSHIDITRQNVGSEDFNKVLDGKTTWDKFVKGLLDKGLVTDGQSVSIQAVDPTNSSTTTITGTVGGGVTNGNGDKLTKRFINKITIE